MILKFLFGWDETPVNTEMMYLVHIYARGPPLLSSSSGSSCSSSCSCFVLVFFLFLFFCFSFLIFFVEVFQPSFVCSKERERRGVEGWGGGRGRGRERERECFLFKVHSLTKVLPQTLHCTVERPPTGPAAISVSVSAAGARPRQASGQSPMSYFDDIVHDTSDMYHVV